MVAMSTEPLSKQEAHDTGVCKPCAFFHRQGDGCQYGESCAFCHFCEKDAMKQRKQVKRQMMKDQHNKLKARSWDNAAAQELGSRAEANFTGACVTAPSPASGGARTPLRSHAQPFVSMFGFTSGLSPSGMRPVAAQLPQDPSSSPSVSFRPPPGLAEDVATALSPVAALTKQRALSLQAELLCAFYAAPTQKKLTAISKTRSVAKDSADHEVKLQKIVHDVLLHIIPKYGFKPSKQGVQQMQTCFQEFKEECAEHARGTRAWITCSEAVTMALFDPEVEEGELHENIKKGERG